LAIKKEEKMACFEWWQNWYDVEIDYL